MNTRFLWFIPLLMLTGSPVMASPPQSTSSSTDTPADRAAMQQEFSQLQKRMDKMARRMGKLSAKLALDSPRSYMYRYVSDPDRGMIGMVLGQDSTQHGFEVQAVTPGGPADQAGLKTGDVIVSVNGKSLQGKNQLPDSLTDIKAGTTLKLGVSRHGKHRTIHVTAEHRQVPDWTSLMAHAMSSANVDAVAKNMQQWMSSAQGKRWQKNMQKWASQLADHVSARVSQSWAPWWGLKMTALNPDLASYFGTQHGALVLSTQSRHYPGLEAGDVITAVDGKRIQQPEDVMRALRDTADGHDKIAHLTVLRHGKSVGVDIKTAGIAPFAMPPAPPPPPAPKPPAPPEPPPAPTQS